ncbi:GNAT family N-acetyltransferase [Paracoccus suum]|uniref:GNAT family N-acetyltransferase n=1 Tax=Paracoccus suum TaxID=2259340 RepID=A0A344PLQ1_9RHOB|nr:GNAT family N-acetyltransferase [Paracoccus suum]AXC50306.1 GNAT family N-acetyltransferase [Paracoccus suum]
MASGITVRPAAADDADAIWSVLQPVFRAGQTYCVPRDITREAALADWHAPPFSVFVAEDAQSRILGTSHVGANRPGGGDHVANASFATAPEARGQGVASALCAHALDWAAGQGFRAMQFNFVVATNTGAIRLWTAHGFQTLCRLPGAFRHPAEGFVDALVMFRPL